MRQTFAFAPLISALLALPLAAGCASPPIADQPGGKLTLESFFPGRSEGDGIFVNSWTGNARRFSVVIDGSWNGSTLTLVEDFNYADGEKDRKTWRLVRTGSGEYSGTREDVVGTAQAWTEGDNVRMAYDVRISGWTLHFADVLALRGDGRLINRATVSKWGIRVGTVELILRKVSP